MNEDSEAKLLERIAVLERAHQAGLGAPPVRRGNFGFLAGMGSAPTWVKDGQTEKMRGLSERLSAGFGADLSETPVFDAVIEYLSLGSPRLALAKALGNNFVPFVINVRADFPSTDTVLVPDVGSDVKIVQDTAIDAALVRITNQSNTANLSVFQPESDYFFTVQSGIEAILSVQGAPRYTVAEKFTPLATLFDTQNGSGFWPRKWCLTYQQQFFMSFQATVTLPYAPLDVTVTWRAWVPQGDAFTDLSNRDALERLATECGVVVTDAYRDRILGVV